MDPVKPNYEGANVTNVVPALLGLRPVDWLPEAVAGARSTVLLVLDGLGWDVVSSPGRMPVVGSMGGGAITTVVPSTTAAALTSITTGVAPARHGITGYRMRFDDTVLNAVRWQRADGRRAPDPRATQRVDPFAGRPVPVVSKSAFRRSGFTDVHLRGGEYRGWPTSAVLVEHVRALIAAGEPLVYAYYPGLDEVGHEWGIEGREFAAELAATDGLVRALVDVLPDDTALVVTADHGQVQVGPSGWRGLGALDDVVATYAGEGRFRHLHARRGAGAELHAAARDAAGDAAWVFTREQLLDEGWLGPDVRGPARRGVGDVVLAARGVVGFLDPTYPQEGGLIGAHGSLTAAEMLVPLVAARGSG
ncbi:MAG: alkaline phosphatase family protein [Acidimicrobiia bacterium]